MELTEPQRYISRVSEKYFLTDNKRFLLIKLELIKPERISFLAGQYLSIKVNEAGERRSYSIASSPDVDHGVTIVAELLTKGKGSVYLMGLELGDEVEILAPLGRFVVEEIPIRSGSPHSPESIVDDKADLKSVSVLSKRLFVATGSGIVPIYSMINDLLINKKETRSMRLHWGLREEADIFWFDNFGRLTEEHPNFVFDLVLSKAGDEWELCSGHVQDCLERDFPLGSPGLSGWEGYVCGSQRMVEEVEKVLRELGMKKDDVHYERFR